MDAPLPIPFTFEQTLIMLLVGSAFVFALIILFVIAHHVSGEKNRLVILGLVSVVLLSIFFGIVDPVMGGGVVKYADGEIWKYWSMIPIIYGLIAIGVAFGSLLGDFGKWSKEDYYGSLLLILTPILLILGGLMDWLSMSVIEWFGGAFAVGFPWFYEWWWLDWWSIPFWLSRGFSYEHTQGFMIPFGITLSVGVLIILWWLYYKHT